MNRTKSEQFYIDKIIGLISSEEREEEFDDDFSTNVSTSKPTPVLSARDLRGTSRSDQRDIVEVTKGSKQTLAEAKSSATKRESSRAEASAESVGMPPGIERATSEGNTIQSESTCGIHVMSKVLLHNICQLLMPIILNASETAKYKRCLATDRFDPENGMSMYTPGSCSPKGFIHIFLLYNFYIYLKPLKDVIKQIGTRTIPITKLFYDMSRGTQNVSMNNELNRLITASPLKWSQTTINATHEMLNDINEILEQIFRLNLYVYVSLERDNSTNQTHGRHAVMMVGMNMRTRTYQIKNTWSKTGIVDSPFNSLKVLLPISNGNFKEYDIVRFILLLPTPREYPPVPDTIDTTTISALASWIPKYFADATGNPMSGVEGFLPNNFRTDREYTSEGHGESGGKRTKNNFKKQYNKQSKKKKIRKTRRYRK
jgi:hypothetical protein